MAHPDSQPKKENYRGYRITNVWLFVSVDHDGDEGVCAFRGTDGWMPMVAADERRLHQLIPIAQEIANARGIRIEVRAFGGPETHLVIEPRKENDGGSDTDGGLYGGRPGDDVAHHDPHPGRAGVGGRKPGGD